MILEKIIFFDVFPDGLVIKFSTFYKKRPKIIIFEPFFKIKKKQFVLFFVQHNNIHMIFDNSQNIFF